MLFQAPTLVSLYLFLPFSHLSSFLFLSLLSLPNPSPLHRPHSSVPCSGNGPAPNCHPRPAPTVRSDQTTTHRPLLVLPSPSSSSRQKPVSCFPKKYSPQPQAFTVREISHEYRLSNFFPPHKCIFGKNADSRRIY